MRRSEHRGAITALAVLCVSGVLGTACLGPTAGQASVRPSSQPGHSSASEPTTSSRTGGQRQVVWVALEDAHRIARVNLRTRRVVRRLQVSGRPHNITVNKAGLMATTLWNNERVALVKGRWRKGVRLAGAPHDVKIGGGRIVVSNQGAARLNIIGPKGKRRGRVLLKANPHDLALTPNGNLAWVSLEGSDDLAVVNLERRRVRRYVSTGRSPHDLLFSPDGRLWVTDWNGAFHVYSRRGRHLRSRSLGQEAHHLAFTPNGRQVWITDHAAHRIFVISTRRYRVIKRLRIGGSPHHIAITPDGKKAVVADHDRGLLIVYRVATMRRRARIRVGAGPHGVWAVP